MLICFPRNVSNSVVTATVSGIGKPLIVNTSQPQVNSQSIVTQAAAAGADQTNETILAENEEEDMVTITGEDGLVYKVIILSTYIKNI